MCDESKKFEPWFIQIVSKVQIYFKNSFDFFVLMFKQQKTLFESIIGLYDPVPNEACREFFDFTYQKIKLDVRTGPYSPKNAVLRHH